MSVVRLCSLNANIERNDFKFPKEIASRNERAHKRKQRERGRRMREDSERGLGRAYVISDSTFERGGEYLSIVLVLSDEIERVRLRKGANLPKQEKRCLGTKRENDEDTKERRKKREMGDGDCFVGDMIILSLNIFKEDVERVGSTELRVRKRECSSEGERDIQAMLVQEKQSVTRCISVRILIHIVIEPRENREKAR